MKAIFFILFLIFGPQAWAQTVPGVPVVFPAQVGSAGSPFKVGSHDGIAWLAWSYEISNGRRKVWVLCGPHDYVFSHPVTEGLTPIQTARAYWRANVTFDCRDNPLTIDAYIAAMHAMRP